MFKTRVTRMLGIKYPIVGGTMASISNADFAAAISDAGGIGVELGKAVEAQPNEGLAGLASVAGSMKAGVTWM